MRLKDYEESYFELLKPVVQERLSPFGCFSGMIATFTGSLIISVVNIYALFATYGSVPEIPADIRWIFYGIIVKTVFHIMILIIFSSYKIRYQYQKIVFVCFIIVYTMLDIDFICSAFLMTYVKVKAYAFGMLIVMSCVMAGSFLYSLFRVRKRVMKGMFLREGPGLFNKKKATKPRKMAFLLIAILGSGALLVYHAVKHMPVLGQFLYFYSLVLFLCVALPLGISEFVMVFYCKIRFPSFHIPIETIQNNREFVPKEKEPIREWYRARQWLKPDRLSVIMWVLLAWNLVSILWMYLTRADGFLDSAHTMVFRIILVLFIGAGVVTILCTRKKNAVKRQSFQLMMFDILLVITGVMILFAIRKLALASGYELMVQFDLINVKMLYLIPCVFATMNRVMTGNATKLTKAVWILCGIADVLLFALYGLVAIKMHTVLSVVILLLSPAVTILTLLCAAIGCVVRCKISYQGLCYEFDQSLEVHMERGD